jgi:hypothetical protein
MAKSAREASPTVAEAMGILFNCVRDVEELRHEDKVKPDALNAASFRALAVGVAATALMLYMEGVMVDVTDLTERYE